MSAFVALASPAAVSMRARHLLGRADMPGTAQRPNVVIVGGGFAGLEATQGARPRPGRGHAGRCPQPSLLPAAALSGRDRVLVAGRCRLADSRHPATAKQRPRDHGARHRHRRRGAPCAHKRDRSSLRLSAPRRRSDPLLFRSRRLGGIRARAQAHRRCDRDQAALPDRLRTRRGDRGRDRAAAPLDLRHCRRRPDRRGDGRRDCRSRAPDFAT